VIQPDWGPDEEPARFGGSPATPSSQVADALPEVLAARSAGWFLAPDAPMWVFLPAVWPASSRVWIPDRSTRSAVVWCDDEPPRREPWSWQVADEVEADMNALLAQCGLPPRPAGRLWLLRPPAGFATLDDALRELLRRAEVSGAPIMACPQFVAAADDALEFLFNHGHATSHSDRPLPELTETHRGMR